VQSGNQLGIYLRKDRATVVCLASQGRDKKLLDSFSVSIEGEEVNPRVLCDRIAHVCGERKIRFSEAAVALDCADFMQHSVHSEFADPKKIAATVRFDTEETLATDISDVSVTFRVAAADEEGTRLDVFTAQRALLTEIIQSLQINNIDPVAIDPDIYCLSRYLLECSGGQEEQEKATLYAVLSDCRGYLVVASGRRELVNLRTVLIGPAQDRTSLLTREALVTMGLSTGNPVGGLRAFDVRGEVVLPSVGEKTGFPAQACDLTALAGVEATAIPDCANAVDFSLAYGAVLGLSDKVNSVNFRNDHMPFLGKKMRLQKAVRFFSISLTILLLSVGVFVHSQLLKVNQGREAVRAKLEPDYLAVIPGQTELPDSMKTAKYNLDRRWRNLNAEKTGVGADQESVSAKMKVVLQALNACAKSTDLNVESLKIKGSNITLNGSTSSGAKTSEVFDALAKQGLLVGNQSVSEDGKFTVKVVIKKQSERS
jgi:type II secretory pathway component PulL